MNILIIKNPPRHLNLSTSCPQWNLAESVNCECMHNKHSYQLPHRSCRRRKVSPAFFMAPKVESKSGKIVAFASTSIALGRKESVLYTHVVKAGESNTIFLLSWSDKRGQLILMKKACIKPKFCC